MLQLHSKVVRWWLLTAGVALAVASLVADHLTGEAQPGFGPKQLFGCLLGLGVSISSLLLAPTWHAANGFTIRWVAALYCAACALALSLLARPAMPTAVLLGYVAAICLLLPMRFGILTLIGVLGLQGSAALVSRIKIALTGLPLTILDLRIAVQNPAGLWDAMSFPHWTRHVAVTILVLILLWWLGAGIQTAISVLAQVSRRGVGREAFARLAAIVVFGALAILYVERQISEVAARQQTWDPEGVSKMASQMGVLPFLVHSYAIEAQATGDIYREDDESLPLTREEVREAVSHYMSFEPIEGELALRQLPNIVMVLAESTFDPGRTFRLHGQWNDELFRPGPLTTSTGPLRVNALGGGTWITEFETIVGLDARLFGYAGYYTHASVAPFIERSFATYLHERGYKTLAFFPHHGRFYNARNAYEYYGFDVIRDSDDLGQGTWFENDRKIIETVTGTLGSTPEEPFFAYVLLLENHAPHNCGFTDASRLQVRFADESEFGPNCALYEYLRRLDSTTAAIRSMRQYLADIEARTGHPFVLLVFGDHQPHTFTGTGGLHRDYAPLRRSADLRTTFFHFQATAPGRLNCCSAPPPASVLPTLLSAYVADGLDDVYLGENLWLFSQCGSDAIRIEFAEGMSSLQRRVSDDRSSDCRSAYQRAVASYQVARILRLATFARAKN